MNYRWDLEDIRKKKKYVMERLSNVKEPLEKEKLELTLLAYLSMLDNSGTIRYTSVSNLLDKITKGKYTLSRDQKFASLENNLFSKSKDYIDSEYLSYLIQLSKSVGASDLEEIPLKPMELTEEQIVSISKDFYAELGDKKIYDSAMKQLGNNTHINFFSTVRNGWEGYNGVHYADKIFGDNYCNVKKENTLMDVQALNHEVMHSIDSSVSTKTISNNYYGFHEVPTYTIDFLMFEYLEKNGFDLEEINKLRHKKNVSMQNMARDTLRSIYSRLLYSKGLRSAHDFNAEDILNGITFNELRGLTEVQSYIMSYGLSLQILDDKEKGISNLKQFMETTLPKDKVPDFSNIGLSNEMIAQLGSNLGQQLLQVTNSEEISSHKTI